MINSYLFPIIAVVIGFLLAIILRPSQGRKFKLLLAFSGAFLLSITVFEMIPEVFGSGNTKRIGLFVMLGILLQIFLEFFSKGAEHGHLHSHKSALFPWLLFISLSIHAYLEGFPIDRHEHVVFGIVVHKIPIAIILTTFLMQSNLKKYLIVIFLILFAIMTPLGTLTANSTTFLSDHLQEIMAIVIGIFLHISTTILFESSEGHKFNLTKLLVIIGAIAIAYLI